MTRTLLAFALAPVLVTGCKEEPPPTATVPTVQKAEPAAPAAQPAQPSAAATPTAAAGTAQVHDVACGCSLKEVGQCGNMIKVEDKYMPLTGDIGLGKMEFCGREGLKAEVAGEVRDGQFVATSFKLKE